MKQHRPTPRELKTRSLLENELMKRCEKNPRYSLRAFAKALDMSHTNLSFILSGKRPISKKTYRKIIMTLGIENPIKKDATDAPDFDEITLDHQLYKSEWVHQAILTLMDIKNVNVNPKAISKIFKIQEIQAKNSIERLSRLGYISQQNGKWIKNRLSKKVDQLSTKTTPKMFHKSMLEKAEFALENIQTKKTIFETTLLALNASQFAELVSHLKKIEKEILLINHENQNSGDVYALNLQLFPLNSDPLKK